MKIHWGVTDKKDRMGRPTVIARESGKKGKDFAVFASYSSRRIPKFGSKRR